MLVFEFLICLLQSSGPNYFGYDTQDALSYDLDIRVAASGKVECDVEYSFKLSPGVTVLYLDRVPGENWLVDFFTMTGVALEYKATDYAYEIMTSSLLNSEDGIVRFRAKMSGFPDDGLYRERNYYGDTYLFSDGFPARTRAWLPCEDSNSDRADFNLTLTIPKGWVAIGAGDWREVLVNNSHVIYQGNTRSPIPPSLFAFAAGPFARVAEEGDDRFSPHYVFPQDVKKGAEYLASHSVFMEWMEEKFGPYLYAKYTTVQVPTRWGGMEYPGNVWLAQKIFNYPGGGVSTMAHEFAHMWFGDGVGYASWSDSWLSEGFASYFGPILYTLVSKTSLEEEMSVARDRWRRSRRAHGKPVIYLEFDSPEVFFGKYAANTYQKGAWILHMLRIEVGDEMFFSSIKDYYSKHAERSASTDDLLECFERVCERKLRWFFEQWLSQPGCPTISASFDDSGQSITVTSSPDSFSFDLEIQYTTTNGDEKIRRCQFKSGDKEQIISLEGSGNHTLVLDPGIKLLFIEG
jgi:aminopeptidase N